MWNKTAQKPHEVERILETRTHENEKDQRLNNTEQKYKKI